MISSLLLFAAIQCTDPEFSKDTMDCQRISSIFFICDCLNGYNITLGDRVLVCGVNGKWAGEIPTCSSNNAFLLFPNFDILFYSVLSNGQRATQTILIK